MPGGKNNTQRIETLETQTANMSARLDVHDIQLKGIHEGLKKSTDTAEGHTSKITIIEEKLVVLVDFKACMSAVSAIEKELVAFRKDLESLQKWRN